MTNAKRARGWAATVLGFALIGAVSAQGYWWHSPQQTQTEPLKDGAVVRSTMGGTGPSRTQATPGAQPHFSAMAHSSSNRPSSNDGWRAAPTGRPSVSYAPRSSDDAAAPVSRMTPAGKGHAQAKCVALEAIVRGKPGNSISAEAAQQAIAAFNQQCAAFSHGQR